jgi:carbamoyltransferase
VAQLIWHRHLERPRTPRPGDSMRGAYLGPRFSTEQIRDYLDGVGAIYRRIEDPVLLDEAARLLADGNVVGWFDGRMEFGPRALGARSILGDARSPKIQSQMNLKIKYRESFRPFAPTVLEERVGDYFELDQPSPYMLLVAPVREDRRLPMTDEQQKLFGIDKLNVPRSDIPAVTHVDYSARVQTVSPEQNPRYHGLLAAFERETGCGVVVNTSFNVRGEPIVCTPEDAYRCFMRTDMDYLVMGPFLLEKTEQPEWQEEGDWRDEFELD